jgi:Amt family ammonium transporter
LGTLLLWFGWFGFNAGSALTLPTQISEYDKQNIAALAAVNTCVSASIAGIVSIGLNFYLVDRFTGEGLFDVKFCLNGSLAGLVAITAGCGVLEPWASIVVGFIAGFLYVGSSNYLLNIKIDDVVDAAPVHLTNGIWGVISVAFFASPQRLIAAYGHANHPGLFYSFREGNADATLLATQVVGLLFIVCWTAFFIVILFKWLDWKGWLRADSLEEIVGLDTSYHNGAKLHDLVCDEQVDPELYDVFRKQRDDMASRRRSSRENRIDDATKEPTENGHSVPT